jgi:hypothetical protein
MLSQTASRAIADQFGHASTAATDECVRRLNPTQLVDVMTARRWQQEQPNGPPSSR